MPKQSTEIEVKDDAPAVVAYRVKKLEEAVAQGFDSLHSKLEELRDGFVSHDQLTEAIKAANLQHEIISNRIGGIDDRVKKLEKWQDRLIWLVIGSVILAGLALILGPHFVN